LKVAKHHSGGGDRVVLCVSDNRVWGSGR
jgi:hypothetical protein